MKSKYKSVKNVIRFHLMQGLLKFMIFRSYNREYVQMAERRRTAVRSNNKIVERFTEQ